MVLPDKHPKGFLQPFDFRRKFEAEYVSGQPVVTPDGVTVQFGAHQFDHAFMIAGRGGGKTEYSYQRMRRMPWIRAVLESTSCPVYRDQDREGNWCRVQVVPAECYVVVCKATNDPRRAIFITAYVADPRKVQRVVSWPRWPPSW